MKIRTPIEILRGEIKELRAAQDFQVTDEMRQCMSNIFEVPVKLPKLK